MILMPGEVPLRHISTPAKVTDVLRRLCALKVPDSLLKVVQWPMPPLNPNMDACSDTTAVLLPYH